MIARLVRAFFWAILVAAIGVYAKLGFVSAGSREAVLIEDVRRGFEPRVLEPGDFTFVPTRALPGRVRLHRVLLGPRALPFRFRQGLRESVVLGLDDAFFVHLHLDLKYELETARLRGLFRQLDRGDWSKLDDLLRKKLDYLLRVRIAEMYARDADLPLLAGRLTAFINTGFLEDANRFLAADGVQMKSLLVERLYVPDADGYRAMVEVGRREILLQRAERIKRISNAEAIEESQRITDRAYFARLEKIGEVLRRHPHLRDYLAVDRLGDRVEVLVVPSDRWFGRDALDLAPSRRQSPKPKEPAAFPGGGRAAQTPAPPPRADFIDRTPP